MKKSKNFPKKRNTLFRKGSKKDSLFSNILLVLKLYNLKRRLTEKRRRLTRQLSDMSSNHRSAMREK